jgi:hypothetical protein
MWSDNGLLSSADGKVVIVLRGIDEAFGPVCP